MEIQYLGHSCFRIRGQGAVLVTDPCSPKIGLKLEKTTADIVTVSHDHDDHNNAAFVSGTKRRDEPFIINGPGEYEILGVFIYGLASFHDQEKGAKRGKNTIYIIEMEGIKLAHLGDLGHRLTDEQVEDINGVDVLFVPVGGIYTIKAKEAVEVVNQIEPRIVIPMHYRAPGLKFDLAPVEEFLGEMGVEKPQRVESLTVNKEKLTEERQVVVLNARSKNSSS